MRLKWSLNSSHPGFISRSFSALGAVALSAICGTHEFTFKLASEEYRQVRNDESFHRLWAASVRGPACSL